MKKFIIIVIAILFSAVAHAQTVIPATTTVYDFSLMKNGKYLIVNGKDSVLVAKDTALTITKTITIHDTIPRICPVKTQRSMVGLSYNPATNQWIVTYQDNSTSIFKPSKTLFIQ